PGHLLPVVQVRRCDRLRPPGQTRRVAEQVGDGDPVLAVRGELRPVPRYRRGKGDLAAIGDQQHGQRRHGLRAGVDVDDRVLLPRPGPGRVGEPAPQVNHRLAVDVHTHRGTHLGAAGQTLLEHRTHRREPVIHEALHGPQYPATGRDRSTGYQDFMGWTVPWYSVP